MPGRARRSEAGTGRSPSSSPVLILAGRAFVRGKLQPVEVAIGEDGRIQSVGRVRSGAPRRDVGDSVILPAAVDMHVHFREPGGPSEAETISSGTVGAALGGVTLVGDMPNTKPPVLDAAGVRDKASRVTGRAAVDVLIFAAPPSTPSLDPLAREAGGFKVFMSPTTGIDEPLGPDDLPGLWTRLSRLQLPISVHAEDPRRFRNDGRPLTPSEWNRHRPDSAEKSALAQLERAPASLRLHAAHVTTSEGVRALRGAGLSFEATPHHLLLSEASGTDARFKTNPPLRSEAERQQLWEAFRRGEVPILASDHAPHPREAKELRFDLAPSGVPGVETMVPLLLALVRRGELDLKVLVDAACDRPARWLGQPLGRIAPGHRANLIVVDFQKRTTVEGRALASPCGWTPFEGWEVIRPVEHYRDGERVVEGGEYVGPPKGRVVRPEYALGNEASSGTLPD